MTHISKEDAVTRAAALPDIPNATPEDIVHAIYNDAIEHYLAKRVPLTESQVHSIAQQHHHAGLGINPLNFAIAIEQAHGIGAKP